jgi:hypothetical protein
MNEAGQASFAYRASHAWLRAVVYFIVCLAASWHFGILERLFTDPLYDPQELSASWWILTLLVSADVVFAYFWFWPQGTVTHGRPRRITAGIAFGILWGCCQGQLMLVVYELIAGQGFAIAVNVALMFLVWSVWTALWHSRYWDVKVAPEHNIEEWNLRKVLVAHVPFLILSTTHYALFGNVALFVAWQIVALMASTLFMRFPAPRDA